MIGSYVQHGYVANELQLEADGQLSFLTFTPREPYMGRYFLPDTITVDSYLNRVVADDHTDAIEWDETRDMMDRLDRRISTLRVSMRHGVISAIRSDDHV